jgi:hypothetical protein
MNGEKNNEGRRKGLTRRKKTREKEVKIFGMGVPSEGKRVGKTLMIQKNGYG